MKINYKYTLSQGLFWMMYCVVTGYAAYYLLEQGFSTIHIGIFTTIFAICTALMQVIVGRLADRQADNWKKITIILSIITVVADVCLCMPTSIVVKGIIFGVGYVSTSCLMPIINQISFYYIERGEDIDFGKARGAGSLLYALYSLALGQLTVMIGSIIVPVSGCIIAILMLVVMIILPLKKKLDNELSDKEDDSLNQVQTNISEASDDDNKTPFLKKYKYFIAIWIGFIFFMIMHMMTNNYMLQIATNAGGDSGDMGVALSIAAVAELPVMIFFNKIIAKISSIKLLLIAGIGFCIKGFMYVMCVSTGVLFATQVLQLISFAVFANASVYFSNEQMSEKDKATGQSLMTNTLVIGQIAGNMLGGTLIDMFSVRVMTITGFVSTLIGLGILVISILIFEKKNNSVLTD